MEAGKDIRFDGWTLNRQSGELLRDGVRVRLQTHPQQVLEALLERPGELVSREQLIARLWPKGVVDFDTALNSTVRRLRIALGDDADTPRYIETLPRRGYRFIGTIESPATLPESGQAVPSPAPTTQPASPGTPAAAAHDRRREPTWKRRAAVLAAAAALVMLAVAITAWLQSGDSQGTATATGTQDRARAVEAYERAKFLLGRRSPGDVELAEKYFEQATEYDPGYALAWSGLASARWIATIEGRVPRAQGLARLRDAAERALAIDPTLAEPHLRLANYRWVAGDGAAAHAHVRRAMELEPRNPLVLGFAASRAADDGKLDEAIRLQRRAVEVEPLVGAARYNLATMLYAAGDLEAAETELRRLLEISPATPGAGGLLALVLVRQGRHDDALALIADDPYGIEGLQVRALVHFASGRTAEADAALRGLAEACSQDERYRVAEVYAYRGDLEQAFAWLESGPSGESRNPAWYKSRSPFLEPLHADPRWQAWLDAS